MNQSLDIQKSKDSKERAAIKAVLRLQAEILQEGNVSMGSYVTDGEDRFIIGSSKRADIVVPHEKVSQIHAMLRLIESDILLYDLGSEAGTFVDGKKIVERKLNPGETFEIGGHSVRVSLLDRLTEKGGERALFWKCDCTVTPDRLEVVRLENGTVSDERTLLRSSKILFGRRNREMLFDGAKGGEVFLARNDSGNTHTVEALMPPGYVAEIFDGKNELVRVIEQDGSKFVFNTKEKVRLISPDQSREILILWQEQGARVSRVGVDHESPMLKKALGTCLAIALFLMTVMVYVVPLKHSNVEEAAIPTSSYERLTMAPPQPAAQPSAGEAAKEDDAPAKPDQQKDSPKAVNISSSLAKLLNKKSSLTAESIQEAISKNGSQTIRNASVKNANIQSQNISAGNVGGGAVNVNALSAGLSNSSGAKAGSLKGFGGGKGSTIGSSGFGGKTFDMSIGGEDEEEIGGLDKALIAAVVQSNIGQIKHCYERQLIVDPNIYGKVVAAWTIDGNGNVSVSNIKKTTMNNKVVEGCIAARIKSWSFPKPKGGGTVLVSYPFLFKSLN
jgi:pSer/pThr/pTyr-binding forkhead associated (FHA) protein